MAISANCPIRHLIMAIGLVYLVSCGQNDNFRDLGQVSDTGYEEMGMIQDAKTSASEESHFSPAEDIRKIIKEGNIRFETTDARETKNHLLELVAFHKGYVSNDYANSYGDLTEYTITVRIPATGFDQVFEKITGLAKKIESQHISSFDVTEEFIDINSRITTKKALENRYKELLQEAETVEDILKIEKDIGNLRSEIESIEGRLHYLKNQTTMSTLVVAFYEKSASSRVGPSIGGALINGWNNLLSFLLWLLNSWPFVLMAVVAALAAFRFRNRRN